MGYQKAGYKLHSSTGCDQLVAPTSQSKKSVIYLCTSPVSKYLESQAIIAVFDAMVLLMNNNKFGNVFSVVQLFKIKRLRFMAVYYCCRLSANKEISTSNSLTIRSWICIKTGRGTISCVLTALCLNSLDLAASGTKSWLQYACNGRVTTEKCESRDVINKVMVSCDIDNQNQR